MRVHEELRDEFGNRDEDLYKVEETPDGLRRVCYLGEPVATFHKGWEDLAGDFATYMNETSDG